MEYNQVIDEILTEWAYRVPNGMPDMSNASHKSILYDVIYDLNYDYILQEKKEKITVHKGQNPTTFYHEVLTALAVAGVDMNKINNGDDMKEYMDSKVKAGVPGKSFSNYPQKKYMENSTHSKFDKLKTDAIKLSCEEQEKGISTFIEVILNQELGEPFRRDAMKKPVKIAGIKKEDMKPQVFDNN